MFDDEGRISYQNQDQLSEYWLRFEKKQKKNSDSAREKNLRRKFGQFGNNRYLCSRNKNNNDDGNNCKKKDNYSRKGKEEDIGV